MGSTDQGVGAKNSNADGLSRREYIDDSMTTDNCIQSSNVNAVESMQYIQVHLEIPCQQSVLDDMPLLAAINVDDENDLNIAPSVPPEIEQNQADLSKHQWECDDFKPILEFFVNDKLPETGDKKIRLLSEQYILKNNILYHIYEPKNKKKKREVAPCLQVAVPKTLRSDVIISYHDGHAHLGVFLFTLIITLATTVDGSILIQRLNYGSVFEKQGQLSVASEHWKHTFVLDYVKPAVTFKVNNDYGENLQGLFDLNKYASRYVDNTIAHMNQIIKDQKPNTNRKRRSLLPFIGTIGKELFGLATQEDVQDVARHVNQLIKDSQALELGFRGNNDILQYFINHTDERINNVFNTENHKVIAALATDFNNNRKSFQENQVLFINAMTKTIKYLTSLENAYGTMLKLNG
ncbi:hypothetical protein ACF0H5_001820 [Mactra antiquata]